MNIYIYALLIFLFSSCLDSKSGKNVKSELKEGNVPSLFVDYIKTNYKQLPDYSLIGIANHSKILSSKNNKFLEYKGSVGIYEHIDIKMAGKYDSSKPWPWFFSDLNYLPVIKLQSDILDYNGNQMKILENIKNRDSHLRFSAIGYHTEIPSLISALMSFGPLNPDKLDVYIIDSLGESQNLMSYHYKSLSTNCIDQPFMGEGEIIFDKESKFVKKITGLNINYNTVFHGVTRNFCKNMKADVSFTINFKVDSLLYIESVDLKKEWVRNEGVGSYAPRPNANDMNLVELETFTFLMAQNRNSLNESIDEFTKNAKSPQFINNDFFTSSNRNSYSKFYPDTLLELNEQVLSEISINMNECIGCIDIIKVLNEKEVVSIKTLFDNLVLDMPNNY